MFTCPLCTKTFSSQCKLDRHMVTHTKEKPHKCLLCPVAYGREDYLKQHIKIVHDGIKKTKNKNHQCTMCSFKCCYASRLQVHIRKHFTELPFSCHRPGCGYRTKYKYDVSKHARQAHSDKRPFKCPSDGCSYKAKTSENIRAHLKIHSNDKPFACTFPGCNYTSKSKTNLKRHTSTVHSNEKQFKCSTCAFQTNTKCGLVQHELTHKLAKRFQCQAPNCSYASHQSGNLKVHIDRKHRTNEVLCTELRCNFKCGSIALLKLHYKKHELPILKCPGGSCGFRTKYNRNLLKHISSRHNDFNSAVTNVGTKVSNPQTAGLMNTLQCSYTDSKFRKHYDRHIVTHKKEETGQHVCSFCFSRFSQSSKLKAHVHRHIREKPYSCSHCYLTTGDSSRLKRHARKIHHIYVNLRDKDDQVRKCRTCGRNCFSYGESVLHSMSHLQPIVVLEQLKLRVL